MYLSNFHAVKLCRCYFDEIVKDDCEEKMYFWWGVLTCSLVMIIEIIELVHSFFVLLWITLVLIPLFSIVVNWMYIYLLLYNHDKSNYREDHILPLLYVLKVENCELLTGLPSHLLLKSHYKNTKSVEFMQLNLYQPMLSRPPLIPLLDTTNEIKGGFRQSKVFKLTLF